MPWWIVPLVVVGLVVIAFLVLMGLPFGGKEPEVRTDAPTRSETIADGVAGPSSTPEQSATLIDVGEEGPAAAPPPLISTPVPTPVQTQPPVETLPGRLPETRPRPVPVRPPPQRTDTAPAVKPAPEPATNIGEATVSDAIALVRSFVTSRDYYGTGADCIAVGSLGYQNAGYTLDVRNSCSSRFLGRWRVDAKTREIFRQQEDGRYLRP